MVRTQEVRDNRVTESHAELQEEQGRRGGEEEDRRRKSRKIMLREYMTKV